MTDDNPFKNSIDEESTEDHGGVVSAVINHHDQMIAHEEELKELNERLAALEAAQGDLQCATCGSRFYAEEATNVTRRSGLLVNQVTAVECPACNATNTARDVGVRQRTLTRKVTAANTADESDDHGGGQSN